MRNGQAYQRKTEKFFVSEEKKFGKIDSWNYFWMRQFVVCDETIKSGIWGIQSRTESCLSKQTQDPPVLNRFHYSGIQF